MTIEDKYKILIKDIASMYNERNYYATFALFGDSIHEEIVEDIAYFQKHKTIRCEK